MSTRDTSLVPSMGELGTSVAFLGVVALAVVTMQFSGVSLEEFSSEWAIPLAFASFVYLGSRLVLAVERIADSMSDTRSE